MISNFLLIINDTSFKLCILKILIILTIIFLIKTSRTLIRIHGGLTNKLIIIFSLTSGMLLDQIFYN